MYVRAYVRGRKGMIKDMIKRMCGGKGRQTLGNERWMETKK